MKKFVSIMLSLFIFLMCSTAAFSADLLTIYFDPYEKSTEEKAIITSSAATDELNLYVAAYKDDKMVSVKKSNVTLEQGINVIETGIDWSNIWKDKVKLFVWDKALCSYDSYEFEVSRPPVSELLTFVVTGNTVIDYKGNTAYRLSGTLDGKESRIIIYNPNGYGDEKPENFSLDNVILISKPDGEGVVSYVEKLAAEKIEGVVTQTPMTYVARLGVYDPSEAPVVMIGERKISVGNSLTIDSYLGKAVTAYIVDDEIYSIREKADNSSFAISASQIYNQYDRYWNRENIIGYKPSIDSSKIEPINLDADVITYLNYAEKYDINMTCELADLLPRGGSIEFISNDADSDIEYMLVTAYDDEAVIKGIEQYATSYKFDCYCGAIADIGTEDDDRKVIIYKDGVLSSVENLAEEDTVTRVRIAKNFDAYYVSSENIVGALEAYDLTDYTITVLGMDFRLSPLFVYDMEHITENGGRGIYYINSIGEVAHFEQDEIER